MTFSFDPNAELVVVSAALFGPEAIVGLRLALDTGATKTVIKRLKLETAGYDLTRILEVASVMTGSRIESVPLLSIDSLGCLGEIRDKFSVLAHDLPAGSRIDGVLGLDFLRNHRLILDFRAGEIELI